MDVLPSLLRVPVSHYTGSHAVGAVAYVWFDIA